VSPTDRDLIVDAMRTALDRAGSPWWAAAADRWWQLERAVVAEEPAAAAAAAAALDTLATEYPQLRGRADAAAAWAAVLAGRVCPAMVDAAAARLADAGLRGEAADLCRAAAQRATDPAATRRLLGAGRGLLPGTGGSGRATGLLSEREREVGALVVDGLTQKEIGARLYISPKTVEQHVARMRQKLAASNRATLVAALRSQLGA
jgi:DNA-binding CsgD family transcriptional regulator